MSKILRKILKILVLPAALMVLSKAAGLYLATLIFNLEVFLETHVDGIFSIQVFFLDRESTILANSFSNAFMLFIFTVATVSLVLKYWFSVTSKYNPKTLIRLNNLNLISWINEKDNSFLKVLVWIVFMWIIAILTISDILKQHSYEWLGVIAFVVVIILTWILIRTFETELNNSDSGENLEIF
jgi:hypothetical protein